MNVADAELLSLGSIRKREADKHGEMRELHGRYTARTESTGTLTDVPEVSWQYRIEAVRADTVSSRIDPSRVRTSMESPIEARNFGSPLPEWQHILTGIEFMQHPNISVSNYET